MSTARARRGRWMWGVVAVFALLHWDFWLWDDTTLWFGFLPAGLGYHALYSLAAGGLWALFIRVAWPAHIEEWASAGAPERGESPR
jgi:hypothetical protein